MSSRRTATVVGAGPAGLFAAERLAHAGVTVTVYEHRRSVGRKFLLAGRGGLNITHTESVAQMLGRYAEAEQRLAGAIAAFGPDDLREWCAGLGEPTFVGTSGRVFPESFRATPLLRAWLRRLTELGVQMRTSHRWTGWDTDGLLRFTSPDGDLTTAADITVFALGGASWPRVGSDGGWVESFREAGIEVRALVPANGGVVVAWAPVFSNRFAGVPLKNVAVSVAGHPATRGDVMVTSTGLEGGPIYACAAAVRDALGRDASGELSIDLAPDLLIDALTERLRTRRPKETATRWLQRAGLDPVAISLLREATRNELPTDAAEIAGLVKRVPVSVQAMMPIDRAISSAGGVAWDALDEGLMLRSHPGSYVVGEMVDWEAPTGGYLLQACFSTAFLAAETAIDRLPG